MKKLSSEMIESLGSKLRDVERILSDIEIVENDINII